VKRWSLAIVVLLAAAAAVVIWQVRVSRQQAARLAQSALENAQLRQRVADLTHATAVPAAVPAQPAAASPGAPGTSKPAANPEDAIAIQLLKISLADANASVARLQLRADEAEAQVRDLTVDNKRLAASEADLKEDLSAVNNTVNALEKELKSNRDRVSQVEIAYQRLRDQSGTDAHKLTEIQQLDAELQSIHKRREVYLNGILRRYRQITEQYRSMAGMMQTQRTDAPAAGSADLARIQDSIAMAEEDLRQLNNLNAQALLIQKKMAAQ
jgi:DNA repair exonuclease SbcCD ATPase subunit